MDSNNSEKTEITMTIENTFSTEEMVQASGVVKWWICVLTLHQSISSSTFHRWTDHLSFLKRKIWHHPVEKFQVACEKIHKTHKNKNPFRSSNELKVQFLPSKYCYFPQVDWFDERASWVIVCDHDQINLFLYRLVNYRCISNVLIIWKESIIDIFSRWI